MRYFVVQQEDVPIAVVFHDHVDQVIHCRSRITSFLSAFEAMCAKNDVGFVREDDQVPLLRTIHRGVEDYDWVENVLDHLEGDLWTVVERGNAIHTSAGIDSVIQKYLT